MAISSVGTLLGQNDKTAGTSFTVTTESANLTAGRIGILVIAKDNAATTDAETLEVTDVDDAVGNPWYKVGEFCNSQAAANGGATVAVYLCKATTNLGNAANITITLSDSRTAKAVTGWVFEVAAGKTLVLDSLSTLANDGADAGNITLSGLANVEHLFLRAGAIEDPFSTYTPSTNYTTFEHTGANTTGGGGATNMAARGEFRILTGTSDSTDPTTVAADQASIMLAFSEVDQGAVRFIAADSQYIQCAAVTNAMANADSSGAISFWFRTRDKGVARRTMYNEGSPGGVINLFIGVNETTNGQIRVFRRDGSSNAVDMTWAGSLADNAWHHVCYNWSAVNNHTLYVDGISRATSATNLSGTLTVDSQAIGCREATTGTRADYFEGEIADVAIYTRNLTGSEVTNLATKASNAYSVTTTKSDRRSYWTLAPVKMEGTEYLRNVWRLDDAKATNNGSSIGSGGPSGNVPTAMTLATDVSKAWIWANVGTSAFITRGASAGDSDRLLREQGNLVHTPNDTGKEFKFYYAGSPDAYTGSNAQIHMAYASTLDGTWTKQGVVVPTATIPTEDPWVFYNIPTTTYHMWCENKTGGTNANGIAHLTSSDGITWTLENGTAIDSTPATFDSQDVSTPIVWREGSTWYMLYEGRTGANDGRIGLATASSPDGPWTKSGSNPVLTWGGAGEFDEETVAAKGLVKIGSTYWLAYIGWDSGQTNSRQGVASSTDLVTWTKAAHNPISGGGNKDVTFGYTGMLTAFDRMIAFYPGHQAGIELYKWQLIGDPAVQVAEWPDINPDKPDTMHVINFAPTRAAFY